MTIQSVCVIGGGAMGMGILRAFAGCGLDLSLVTRDPAAPKPGLPVGTRLLAGFDGPAPNLVVESVPEDMGIKHDTFARAEAAWGGRSIMTSNTSVLALQDIADALRFPERFCGLHFMYPADVWPFVELISVAQTGPDVADEVAGALERAGRQPIRLHKPIEGALINRLQHSMAHEAYSMVADGVVDVATVDLVMRRLLAPRMCVTGLIEQKDISGIGTHAASQEGLVPYLSRRDRAVPFLREMVERGEQGIASGLGFYDWREADTAAYRAFVARNVRRMMDAVAETEQERVAVAPKPRRHPAP